MRRVAAGAVVVLALMAAEMSTFHLDGETDAHELSEGVGHAPTTTDDGRIFVTGVEAHASPQPTSPPTLVQVLDPAPTPSRATAPQPVELPPGGTFFDDDGSIHEPAIEAIAAAGITTGCGTDLYCPQRSVTRGEMAAYLRRSLGLPAPPGPFDRFEDDDGGLFEADIEALASAGITRGCDPPNGFRFCPRDPVSRGEMAAFLDRALGLSPSATNSFVDDDASIFERHIDALEAAGITVGCGGERYCPNAPVSRQQMASFLQRALVLTLLEPPPRPAVTLAFTGDVLIHSPVWEQAARYGEPFDFSPMFDPVADIIAGADLAICHLETPLSADSADLSGYPTFNAPRQVADALAKAGYDGCSTASNHSFDQGQRGIAETLSVLEDAGLGHAGMAAHAEDAATATRYRVGAVDVAHLSATWWLNGLRLPRDRPWLVQVLDVDALLAQAAAARREGADIVVVSMHCCTEYLQEPTSYQRHVARSLIHSPDVDLVIGHHAHVVQPAEMVDGEAIVYGLGNFLSAQRSLTATQDGVVVLPELALRGEHWSLRSLRAVPTWVEGGSYRILPAASANGASWERTRAALSADGVEVEVLR